MRYLAILLLCSYCCFAQTKPIKSKALSKCETDLAASTEKQQQYLVAGGHLLQEKEALEANNKELADRNLELSKQLTELRAAASDVLKFNGTMQTEYFKLLTNYNGLIDKYNSSLTEANAALQKANERLAKRERLNNQMLIWAMMPKYQPPPVTVYQMPVHTEALNVHCTSQKLGDFTYTNCN